MFNKVTTVCYILFYCHGQEKFTPSTKSLDMTQTVDLILATSNCVGLEWQCDLISNIFTGQSLDRLHQIEIALEGLHSEKPHFWFDYSSSSNVTSGLLHLLPLNSSNKWIIAVNIDDHIFVSFGDGLAFCFLHSCLCLILVCSC